MSLTFHRVGGTVRDRVAAEAHNVDFDPHDDDLAVTLSEVVANEQVADTVASELEALGFKVFKVDHGTMTCRAKVPANQRHLFFTDTVDFAHTREESSESDGRRPDAVWAVFGESALLKDLARRDFSVGAMAEDLEGNLFDPFSGADDVRNSVLRFVGEAEGKSLKRVEEDGLRVMRGLRFMVTKNLMPTRDCWAALTSDTAVSLLLQQAVERVREELQTMMVHDTVRAMQVLTDAFAANEGLAAAVFRERLHLEATTKQR